jgi:hypothetical protein
MDLERIERALRQGPADEPVYVAGGFRRAGRRRSMLLVTAAVGSALVVGVVLGLGLDTLRSPSGDTGVPALDLEALNAELAGTWLSDPITRDQFVDFMVEAGHAEADIDAFLEHDPIVSSSRFGLAFDGRARLVVFEMPEGGIADILSNGPYELLPDGRLTFDDLGCVVTARFTIAGDRLTFEPVSLEGCDPDERIANSAFFNLTPYTFSPAR